MAMVKVEKGVAVAVTIIAVWFLSIFALFHLSINWWNPLYYLAILLPTHLYTGLFITAHESWHSNISANRTLNKFLGFLACSLFAYNSYNKIQTGHHKHHAESGSDHDPEFLESRKFFPWFFSFMWHYITLWQFLLMAITTTILLEFFPTSNIIMYYLVPTFTSSLQLFYFGTYLPHRGFHDNRHQSATQKKNHLWAFVSCYFFGYHYEHHHSPGTPWWQLYKLKEKYEAEGKPIPSY